MIVYILAGVMLWLLVGCMILAAVDTKGTLLSWVKSAPNYALEMLALLLWPILAFAFLRSVPEPPGEEGT